MHRLVVLLLCWTVTAAMLAAMRQIADGGRQEVTFQVCSSLWVLF